MNSNDPLDRYFKTMAHLSDENERAIITELLEKGQREMSDFENRLDMTKSSIIRLLNGLEEDGIIESGELEGKRAGRRKKFYKIKNLELPGMNIHDIKELLLEKKLPEGVQSTEISAKLERMRRISVRGKAGPVEFDPTLLVSDLILSGLDVMEAIKTLLDFEGRLVEGMSSGEISDEIAKLLETKDQKYMERYRGLVKKEMSLEPSTREVWRMEDIGEMIRDQFGLKENEMKLIISEFGRFLEFLGYYKFSYNYLMQTLYLLTKKYKMDARKPNLGSFWVPKDSELMIVGKSTNKRIFSAILGSKEFGDDEKKEIEELKELFNKYYMEFTERARKLKIIIPSEDYAYYRKINILKEDNIPDTWEAINFGNYIERKFHLNFHESQYIGAEVFRRLQRMNLEKVPLPLIDELCKEILVEKGMRRYEKVEKKLKEKVETEHFFNFRSICILPKSERSSALNFLIESIADKEHSKQIHIHGVNGWLAVPNQLQHDLRWFLVNGFHLRPVLGPPENITELIQLIIRIIEEFDSEVALSQNFDFFNVFISPFFKGMKYETIKRNVRLLISALDRKNCNVGLGVELGAPEFLKNRDIWAKKETRGIYDDFESESLSIAKAILEVFAEGDPAGNLYHNPKVILKLRSNFPDSRDILEIVPSIIEKYSKQDASRDPLPLIMANCVNDLPASNSGYFCNGQGILSPNWENSFGISNLQTISLNIPTILSKHPDEDEILEKIEDIVTTIANGLTQKRDLIKSGIERDKFRLLSASSWEDKDHYLNLRNSFSTIGISQMRKALSNVRGHFPEESKDTFEFGLRLVNSVQASIDRHMEEMGDKASQILISQANLFSSVERDRFYDEWLPVQFTEANIKREERIQDLFKGGKIFHVERPDVDFQELLGRLTNSSVKLFIFVSKE